MSSFSKDMADKALSNDELSFVDISGSSVVRPKFFNPYLSDFSGKGESGFERSKVNRGTFLPLKQAITQMIQAGVNLSAIRQASYEFSSGVSDDKLGEYEDSTKDVENLFDVDILRKQYVVKLARLKEQESLATSKEPVAPVSDAPESGAKDDNKVITNQ